MRQNKLFNRTRINLALWYSSVMGILFGVLGYGVYQAIAHAHAVTLDRELESISKTFHNGLESKLNRPGILDVTVRRLIPDLCVKGSPCFNNVVINSNKKCEVKYPANFSPTDFPTHHLFNIIGEGKYYLRLLDLKGCPLAFAGNPPPLKDFFKEQNLQTIDDGEGNRYHQLSLILHSTDGRDWGHLQVGRSFKDFDEYMSTVRGMFFLGFPVALGLVGLSSWWLAGLAMKPIYMSYKQIQQFTADAAHELRTPLAATGATLEAFMRQPTIDMEQAKDTLTIIARQNQRLTTIVKDLLLLSRLERQSVQDKKQVCCLNDIVNDLSEELAALAIAAGVDLKASGTSEQPLYVIGDTDRLYRLISNLIVNAIQYTPPEGKVRAILKSGRNYVTVLVQDTGIGISREEQERIFDRFYRVNSDRSRQTGGSGLGLAIALAIVQSHQGSIEVKSEIGQGSVFAIRLPRHFPGDRSHRPGQ